MIAARLGRQKWDIDKRFTRHFCWMVIWGKNLARAKYISLNGRWSQEFLTTPTTTNLNSSLLSQRSFAPELHIIKFRLGSAKGKFTSARSIIELQLVSSGFSFLLHNLAMISESFHDTSRIAIIRRQRSSSSCATKNRNFWFSSRKSATNHLHPVIKHWQSYERVNLIVHRTARSYHDSALKVKFSHGADWVLNTPLLIPENYLRGFEHARLFAASLFSF